VKEDDRVVFKVPFVAAATGVIARVFVALWLT